MKRQPTILAGTALGVVMASASAFALGAAPLAADLPYRTGANPFVLAQAECPEGDAECAERQQGPAEEPEAEAEREAAPEPEPEAEAATRTRVRTASRTGAAAGTRPGARGRTGSAGSRGGGPRGAC